MELLPFNEYELKTSKILKALNNASRSLAELKEFANFISNQHIFINVIKSGGKELCKHYK